MRLQFKITFLDVNRFRQIVTVECTQARVTELSNLLEIMGCFVEDYKVIGKAKVS
jgi:hypothetical protein